MVDLVSHAWLRVGLTGAQVLALRKPPAMHRPRESPSALATAPIPASASLSSSIGEGTPPAGLATPQAPPAHTLSAPLLPHTQAPTSPADAAQPPPPAGSACRSPPPPPLLLPVEGTTSPLSVGSSPATRTGGGLVGLGGAARRVASIGPSSGTDTPPGAVGIGLSLPPPRATPSPSHGERPSPGGMGDLPSLGTPSRQRTSATLSAPSLPGTAGSSSPQREGSGGVLPAIEPRR